MSASLPRYRITELHPLANVARAACDEHYVREHIPMIVAARRSDSAVRVLRYRPHRAEAELVDGHWVAPQRFWRFVFVTYVGEGTLGASDTRRISDDHRNWVQDLRSFEVAHEVRLDRRSGQTSSAKYLVAGDAPPSFRRELHRSRVRLQRAAEDAFGIRMFATNDALTEQEAVDDEAPRQRFTRNVLPVDSTRWYDELVFDSAAAGREFFTGSAARDAIPGGSTVTELTELIAYDRT